MKVRIFLFIALLLFSSIVADSKEVESATNPPLEGTIIVYTSPDLYNLSKSWADEYCKINPEMKVNLIKSADQDIFGMSDSGIGIGFTTDRNSAHNTPSQWSLVVGHDVIVPVMNALNPLRDEINLKGIISEKVSRILKKSGDRNWGEFLATSSDFSFHYYKTDDEYILSGVADYLNINYSEINGITTSNTKELISAIQKDPNAFGFCKLGELIDVENYSLAKNLQFVPIDKNGNGKIDYMEAIYDNLQSFSRGVWVGKYPAALSGEIYSVSSGKPTNENEIAFLKWILSEGQEFLYINGFTDLVYSERQTQLDKFSEPVFYATNPLPANKFSTVLTILFFILIVILVGGVILDFIFRRFRAGKEIYQDAASNLVRIFEVDSMIIPQGLFFDKTHTWAFMRKDGIVKIGIDDFLQHITGIITRIDMRKSGEKIKKGGHLLSIIRNGKQLDIYSPISGTITAQNESLITNSSLLNSAPYSDGWVYQIEPTHWLQEIQFLSMAGKYKAWLVDEFFRLKDFFSMHVKVNSSDSMQVAFQDGGALMDNVLSELGPEVWDDFQTKFIDCTR